MTNPPPPIDLPADESFSGLFAPEPRDGRAASDAASSPERPVWKVLLVDDESDIHTVLRLALRDVEVEGHRLELLDAHSAGEARMLLEANPDVALILLDVVMESAQAGLDLVRFIRHESRNTIVQILLLTGQPGYAPQRKVVADYDIDGYCLKSELSADRIFVAVYAALRTFQALHDLVAKREELTRLTQILREREERFRSVVETAPDAIVLADQKGIIFGWNDGAAHIFGYASEEMLGRSHAALLPESLRQLAAEAMSGIVSGTIPESRLGSPIEIEALHKDGRKIPIELVLGSWKIGDQRNFSAVVRDVTERKAAEANLRLAASVYANSYEGIIVTDAKSVMVDVNPAFSRVTGYSRAEALGKTPALLASGQHGHEFYAQMYQTLGEQDFWQGEIVNRRKNGETYTEILSISVVRDRAGRLQHYIGVFSDISLLKAHEQELYRIAHYDTLTGVANRRLLSDRMAQAMARARRSGRAMAVCYLDLDGFKQVNDTLGHAIGDQLLIDVAERLKSVLRTEDTLARLGGDEFVLLLTELAQVEESRAILDRVLHEVGTPSEISGHVIAVSASIGVTLYPAEDVDADTLLRHADQAMYLAKESGKNSYHFFDADHDRQIKSKRNKLERLSEALANREFVLFYQPKVDLTSGEVVGAEALIRWQHPENGLLAPAEFLPVVEGSRLEIAIGEWVIDQTLQQIADWRHDGLDFTVSANVSANHLLQEDFTERLKAALDRYDPAISRRLELEILETAALADMKLAVQTLTRCRKLGVQFALDDFGTGYSSLTYFLKLPVNVLKVDQSFVRDMLEDPNELGMVESVIRLAQAFNRPVIAEGVETLDHGAMLLGFGCRLAQGYGIARPMPAARMLDWVADWRRRTSWKTLSPPSCDTDVTLLVAEKSHRKWVDRICAAVEDPEAATGLDSGSCSFGRWHRDSGFARYGNLPAFHEIATHHEQTHDLAATLLALAAAGNRQEAMRRLPELVAMRDKTVALLQRLARENGAGPASISAALAVPASPA